MQIETSAGPMEVSAAVFDRAYKEPLVHQVLNHSFAKSHTGSKAQKKRGMVSGGGRKPWRQKGTGNARVGSNRNPLWRGGGRAFAATPAKREIRLNKKMYRQAFCSLISELNRRGGLRVIDTLGIDQPKTRLLAAKLKELSLRSALIVIEEDDLNIYLAARNLPAVGVARADLLDPLSLLLFEKALMTRAAVEKLQERLS